MVDIGSAIAEFRAAHGSLRLGRMEIDGTPVWIKQAGPVKLNRWNRLHGRVSGLFGPMFRSTANRDRGRAIDEEGERLRRYRALGLAVPDVLHASEGALVLEDCGEPLALHLRRSNLAGREALLSAAIRVLADFHRLGLCHGRPFIKDMTLRDGVIHFLDLEENPLRRMSLQKAEARDVWLFLQSAARYVGEHPDALARIFAAYDHPAAGDVRRELRRFVRILRPARILVDHGLWSVVGSDVRRAVTANRMLERALIERSRVS